jgi:hypothetical protein
LEGGQASTHGIEGQGIDQMAEISDLADHNHPRIVVVASATV